MPKEPDGMDRKALIVRAWRRWLLLFIPLFAAFLAGMQWFGAGIIMPLLIGLVIAQLLYQRFANKRSWRSIMWGVHVTDE